MKTDIVAVAALVALIQTASALPEEKKFLPSTEDGGDVDALPRAIAGIIQDIETAADGKPVISDVTHVITEMGKQLGKMAAHDEPAKKEQACTLTELAENFLGGALPAACAELPTDVAEVSTFFTNCILNTFLEKQLVNEAVGLTFVALDGSPELQDALADEYVAWAEANTENADEARLTIFAAREEIERCGDETDLASWDAAVTPDTSGGRGGEPLPLNRTSSAEKCVDILLVLKPGFSLDVIELVVEAFFKCVAKLEDPDVEAAITAAFVALFANFDGGPLNEIQKEFILAGFVFYFFDLVQGIKPTPTPAASEAAAIAEQVTDAQQNWLDNFFAEFDKLDVDEQQGVIEDLAKRFDVSVEFVEDFLNQYAGGNVV
ncbi:unnamed protein product [Vitrella brassicaformis CCMP3155]|uniref:Uncharacterized protein n=1 Tax=Vitrella brassicaformis (strain CCMP3155) TaxID=1169540 RepID=A0A0G4FX31_VITBC|nr:unnamed protein product [Vitrella brassicaformis CCMP3155]|eukprot:CEM19517.1 unnamed protein product [Vitrella brassicaformis CCMP3155]